MGRWRWVQSGVGLVLACSFVVLASPPAYADIIPPAPIIGVPAAELGATTAVDTTVVAAGASAGVALAASAAVIGAGLAAYYGTYHLLSWVFPTWTGTKATGGGSGGYDFRCTIGWPPLADTCPQGFAMTTPSVGVLNGPQTAYESYTLYVPPYTLGSSASWSIGTVDCSGGVDETFPGKNLYADASTPALVGGSYAASNSQTKGSLALLSATVGAGTCGLVVESYHTTWSTAPTIRYTNTARCVYVTNGATTTRSASSGWFNRADPTGIPDVPDSPCLGNERAAEEWVYENFANSSPDVTVTHWVASASFAVAGSPWTYTTPISTNYPDCMPGGAYAPCSAVVQQLVNSTWYTCDRVTVDCTGFDSTRVQSTFRCYWGDYSVSPSDCSALQAWVTAPVASPSVTASSTVAPTVSASASASASASTTASTTTAPNPSTVPSYMPSPSTSAVPIPGPGGGSGGSNCWAGTISWDPVNWVLVPVECALSWSFVPQGSVLSTDTTAIQTAWSSSSVGTFTNSMFGMVSAVPDGLTAGGSGDCAGPGFNFPMPGAYSSVPVHPLAACDAPMSTVATFSRFILGVGVLWTAGLSGLNLILRSVGMQPIKFRGGRDEDTVAT